jgi:hypothetical protein
MFTFRNSKAAVRFAPGAWCVRSFTLQSLLHKHCWWFTMGESAEARATAKINRNKWAKQTKVTTQTEVEIIQTEFT